MKPITERLWTRLTPWTVATSPLDGDIVRVLEFEISDDASAVVLAHNEALEGLRSEA